MGGVPSHADPELLASGKGRQPALGRLEVVRPDAENRRLQHVAHAAAPHLDASALLREVVVPFPENRAHLFPVPVTRRRQKHQRDERGGAEAPPERDAGVSRYHEAGDGDEGNEAASGSGMDERHGDHREADGREHARKRSAPGAEEVEAERHGRHREGGKIVRVVIVQAAQPPGVPVTELESRDHHARIDRRCDQVHGRQTLHVANPADGSDQDQVHQHGLNERTEEQVEAVAGRDGARHGEDHPNEKRDEPLGRRDEQVTGPSFLMSIEQIHHDREHAGQQRWSKRFQDFEQLVDTAHRHQHVPGDADEEHVPLRVRLVGWTCRRVRPRGGQPRRG